MNDLAATIIITIKGNKGMLHNNLVSARDGNSYSVVSHCQVAGTASQQVTTAASGKRRGINVLHITKLKQLYHFYSRHYCTC